MFFVLAPICSAQKPDAEQMMSKARDAIYENPDYSISVSDSLLKTETDINIKAKLLLLKSNAYTSKRNYEKSLKNVLEAKALLTKINDPEMRVTILVSIAIQYQQMELFRKCLDILDESEKQAAALPDHSGKKYSNLGKIYALRGMVYKNQPNIELALEKFLIAVKNLEKIIPKERSENTLSVVYYNMGYCYIDLGRNKEAEQSFLKSGFYAEKLNARSLRAFALKGLAENYQREKKYTQSIELLINAEKLSEGIGDLLLSEGIYKLLADNYLAVNMFDKYLLYNDKYRKTHFLKEQNEFKSINSSIDTQNKENEKRLMMMKSKYRKIDFVIVIIALFLIIFLILCIYKRKKINDDLRNQIQENIIRK